MAGGAESGINLIILGIILGACALAIFVHWILGVVVVVLFLVGPYWYSMRELRLESARRREEEEQAPPS